MSPYASGAVTGAVLVGALLGLALRGHSSGELTFMGSRKIALGILAAAFLALSSTAVITWTNQHTRARQDLIAARLTDAIPPLPTGRPAYGPDFERFTQVLRALAAEEPAIAPHAEAIALAFDDMIAPARAFDQAAAAFDKAGACLPASIPSRPAADKRLALLAKLAAAHADLDNAYYGLGASVRAHLASAGVDDDEFAARFIQASRMGESILAQVCESDVLKHAKTCLTILRDHHGHWAADGDRAEFSDDVPRQTAFTYEDARARMISLTSGERAYLARGLY